MNVQCPIPKKQLWHSLYKPSKWRSNVQYRKSYCDICFTNLHECPMSNTEATGDIRCTNLSVCPISNYCMSNVQYRKPWVIFAVQPYVNIQCQISNYWISNVQYRKSNSDIRCTYLYEYMSYIQYKTTFYCHDHRCPVWHNNTTLYRAKTINCSDQNMLKSIMSNIWGKRNSICCLVGDE